MHILENIYHNLQYKFQFPHYFQILKIKILKN